MRRAGFVLVIALASMVPTIGRGAPLCPAGHIADGNDCDWTGAPTFLSGTAVIDRGEFIATDYVHDDSGANVDGFRSGDLDPGNPVTGMEWPNLRNPASPRNGSTGDNLDGRFRWTGDFGYPPSQPTITSNSQDRAGQRSKFGLTRSLTRCYFPASPLTDSRHNRSHSAGPVPSSVRRGIQSCLKTQRSISRSYPKRWR